MAPAHEDDVASGGRRRNLSWVTLFCFGSRPRERGQEAASAAEGTTPWERSRRRRKKRTVPVDGDLLVATTAADSEVMMRRGSDEEESRKRKGLRLPGCCFLAPVRAPARERSAMDSSSKRRHPERTEHPPPRRSQSHKNSPSEASQTQAIGGSTSNSNGSRSRGSEQPRSAPPTETTRTPTKPSKTGADGVGAFGPVVGLSVVIAVSMAGLLGGRLWAVACVCAWLAALSRLRRTTAGAEEVAVDVDSTDHTEAVVLRRLLERDRRKAVAA